MTASLRQASVPTAYKQTGATLLIAIVFLLVITILGISSMRGVSLESRITANLKQEKTLMAAAEAGLRIGETSISRTAPPTTVRACNSTICMPWTLSELTTDATTIDTPVLFATANNANVANVISGYDTNTKIQWYVVQLGKMGTISQNDTAARGAGVQFYEVNACASTVPCTSDTVTPRVILRTVIARTFP
jgi:type IV pilus assembly protein PilX